MLKKAASVILAIMLGLSANALVRADSKASSLPVGEVQQLANAIKDTIKKDSTQITTVQVDIRGKNKYIPSDLIPKSLYLKNTAYISTEQDVWDLPTTITADIYAISSPITANLNLQIQNLYKKPKDTMIYLKLNNLNLPKQLFDDKSEADAFNIGLALLENKLYYIKLSDEVSANDVQNMVNDAMSNVGNVDTINILKKGTYTKTNNATTINVASAGLPNNSLSDSSLGLLGLSKLKTNTVYGFTYNKLTTIKSVTTCTINNNTLTRSYTAYKNQKYIDHYVTKAYKYTKKIPVKTKNKKTIYKTKQYTQYKKVPVYKTKKVAYKASKDVPDPLQLTITVNQTFDYKKPNVIKLQQKDATDFMKVQNSLIQMLTDDIK